MSGRNVSDVERDLLGLPARFGGLGLPNPSEEAPFSFSSASKVTQPPVEHLLLPDGKELSTALAAQTEAVIESRKAKNIRWKEKVAAVKERLDTRLQRAVDAAEDKGASSWLTALPIADLGFSLSKATSEMPSTCVTVGTLRACLVVAFVGRRSLSITHCAARMVATWVYIITRFATYLDNCSTKPART